MVPPAISISITISIATRERKVSRRSAKLCQRALTFASFFRRLSATSKRFVFLFRADFLLTFSVFLAQKLQLCSARRNRVRFLPQRIVRRRRGVSRDGSTFPSNRLHEPLARDRPAISEAGRRMCFVSISREWRRASRRPRVSIVLALFGSLVMVY